MILDLRPHNTSTLTADQLLQSMKHITIEDLCRVYCIIIDKPESNLTGLKFDEKPKGRKFYITDKGVEHTFTTKKDAYIYLITTYGDLTKLFRTNRT